MRKYHTQTLFGGDEIDNLCAWSDGSYFREQNNSIAAAVWFPEIDQQIKIYGSFLSSSHSSTCAELWGIILCAAAIPQNTTITIFCDNMGVVKSFQNNSRNNLTPRQKLKLNCNLEWSILRRIISSKKLQIQMQWTKAHDVDYRNNTADELARLGQHTNALLKQTVQLDMMSIFLRNVRTNTNVPRFLRNMSSCRYDIAVQHVTNLFHKQKWIPWIKEWQKRVLNFGLSSQQVQRVTPCLLCKGWVKNCCSQITYDKRFATAAGAYLKSLLQSGKDPDILWEHCLMPMNIFST